MVKSPLKVQSRPLYFNVQKEYENFVSMVSHSMLQLAFKRLPLEFYIKKRYPRLSEKTIKILHFSTTFLCNAKVSPYTSTKTLYSNGLNTKADIRIKLSFISQILK